MIFYGDESGHFNNVVSGESDSFSIAVIGGDYDECRHCASKAIREISSLDELKWHNLIPVTKRRFITCVNDIDIKIGYAAFDRERLLDIDNSYLLHQSVSRGQTPWDLIAMGCGYSEILNEIRGEFDMPVKFEFEQIFNQKQSDIIKSIVQDQISRASVNYMLSHANKAIQVADGIAGAAREDLKTDSEWLNDISSDQVTDLTNEMLIQLEYWLDESKYMNTEPG